MVKLLKGIEEKRKITAYCFCTEQRRRLLHGQGAVIEKSSEITAVPLLLETIQIKDNIVITDAMGTQTAIAEKIKSRHADYVLAVKGNQKTLYNDIKDYFVEKEFQKRKREL